MDPETAQALPQRSLRIALVSFCFPFFLLASLTVILDFCCTLFILNRITDILMNGTD